MSQDNFKEHRAAIRIMLASMEQKDVAKIIADAYERMEYLERLQECRIKGHLSAN